MKRPSGDVFAAYALRNLSPAHTYMFRQVCLEKTGIFDVTMRRLEDHDFWLRMSSYYLFLYVDEPVANYFVHDDMMSIRFNQEMREHRLQVQRRAIEMSRFAQLSPSQQARIFTDYWLAQAIRCQPGNLHALLYWLATWSGPLFYDQLNAIRRRLLKLWRRRYLRETSFELPE
jgi:hypothetical protein